MREWYVQQLARSSQINVDGCRNQANSHPIAEPGLSARIASEAIYHYLSKDQDERICLRVIESIQNPSRGAGLLQYACVIARRQRDYVVPLAARRGPARSSLPAANLRLVDHYIGLVSAGKLRLIIGASTVLVGDAVGHDRRAIGWN